MNRIRSLDDLMNGAALERFNKALQEVLQNIFDPNTDAKKTRKVTLTLTIKPDKSRNSAKFYLDAKPTLAPIEPYETNVMLAHDDAGNASAAEFGNEIPGQLDIDDAIPEASATHEAELASNVKTGVFGGRR